MEQRSQCTKTERKILEKNRRNRMKNLYSNLISLLPRHHQEAALSLPLPDQIDATVAYINTLHAHLHNLRDRKQSLTMEMEMEMGKQGKKRCPTPTHTTSSKLEIHEMGSNLEVLLITGLHHQFVFSDVVAMFHEEAVDLLNASFSVLANSIFHTFHAQVGDSMFGYGAAKVTERLKRYVNGCNNEGEMPLNTWDFQIHLDSWEWDQF